MSHSLYSNVNLTGSDMRFLVKRRRDKFYREVISHLQKQGRPFMVGGAVALREYTGVYRDTKDLDLFSIALEVERMVGYFRGKGYEVEREEYEPWWLAKVRRKRSVVDILHNSYHGRLPVDEGWFERAHPGEYLGREVLFVSPEDVIRSKAYMLHRGRFDGADINHIILRTPIDWRLLLGIMEGEWELLLAHLLMFRFVYPNEKGRVPLWVWKQLAGEAVSWRKLSDEKLSRGYLVARWPEPPFPYDVDRGWGYTLEGQAEKH